MRRSAKTAVVVIACIVIAGAGYVLLRGAASRRSIVSYVTRPVSYADISSSVSETGTVNPVNQVEVGSEVSGTIATLNADFNSIVHAGEVLATLDPTPFQASVDSASASLRLARANLANSRNSVAKAKAQKDLAELTVKRDNELVTRALIPQSQYDIDQTAATTANLDYLSAQGAVSVAETQVSVAEAQLQQAQYNLQRTIITSPIDGVVLSRNVSIGQSVAASLQAPTLFVLATSLSDMQVDTAVDEADVGSVAPGQAARITVTAYPNVVFKGTVREVRVAPTTVQNVVTYDAVVAVHDSSTRLLPGMTAQVTIQTGARTHVPSVPIAALLFRPASSRNDAAGSSRGPGGFGGVGGGFGFRGGPRNGGATSTPAVAGAPGSRVLVWVLRNGEPVPLQVTIGLSDERNVEITSGELQVGQEVVVAERHGLSTRRVASGNQGTQRGPTPNGNRSSSAGRGATRESAAGAVSAGADGGTAHATPGPDTTAQQGR